MSNETQKISELLNTSIISENTILPVVAAEGETNSIDIITLRSALLFDKAFETNAAGNAATSKNDSYFVYTDATKTAVLGWMNQGGDSYSPLLDINGAQIRFIAGQTIRGLDYFTNGVNSFADLRTLTPLYAGQRIKLKSWASGEKTGGGEFVARFATATDDGGTIASGAGFYWERIFDSEIDVTFFGADPTGERDSYVSLMNALNYSSNNKILVKQYGICFSSKTIKSPTGIIIDFTGYILFDDRTTLDTDTENFAWVQGLYRGATTDASTTIHNLRLTTDKVDPIRGAGRDNPFDGKGFCAMEYITVGNLYTAGFQLGGVVIKAEKGAIRGNLVETYIRARPSNDSKYISTYGFYNEGADTKIDKLISTKYAQGASTGDFSYYGVIHCWGLPALAPTDSNWVNYQWGTMLLGLNVGTSSYVGFFYCDTPDTTGYDVDSSFDDSTKSYIGYGAVFTGYESKIDNFMFLLYKDKQKLKKVRIMHFKEGRNQHVINYLSCHDGALFDNSNAITYGNRNQDFFQNTISNVSGAYLHQYIDTWSVNAAYHVSFTGVTSHTGTVKYVKRGNSLSIYFNIQIAAVDTSASSFDLKFVNVPVDAINQSATMPIHNFTTWSCIKLPAAAADILSVTKSGTEVGTVSVQRILSGLQISNILNGNITLKFVDISNGTGWVVTAGQLRTGSLIGVISFAL